MSRLPVPRHGRAKLFPLSAPSVGLAAALLAGCAAGDRTSSTLRVLTGAQVHRDMIYRPLPAVRRCFKPDQLLDSSAYER
jgi:hypothetical protein